jgi:hypothetical protein
MKFSEIFSTIGNGIITGAKAFFNAIGNANVQTVINNGLMIGAAIFTAVVLIKGGFGSFKASKTDKDESPVDKALGINYADRRNAEKIDPMMREVRRSVGKDLHFNKIREKSAKNRKWGSHISPEKVRYFQDAVNNLGDDDLEDEEQFFDANDPDTRAEWEDYKTKFGVPLNKDEMGSLDRFTRDIHEIQEERRERGRHNADNALMNILHDRRPC